MPTAVLVRKTGTTNGVSLGRLYTLSQQPNIYDEADLGMESRIFGRDSTAGIQAVLDKASAGPIVVDWDVRCSITATLRVWSNTAIKGRNGCGVIRQDFANCYMFLNKNPRGMRLRDASKMVVNAKGELVVNDNGTQRYLQSSDHFYANGQDNLVVAEIVDENISIENLIINGNGFIGTTAKQAHDTDEGWTILTVLAGTRASYIKDVQYRNQSVFCQIVSNFDGFEMPHATAYCNSSYPINSDGFKTMVGKNGKIGHIVFRTADDGFSVVTEDGLFPWPHSSPGVQGGVNFLYKYACFGPTEVHIEHAEADASYYGGRLMSNNERLDFSLGKFTGTVDKQLFIIDNFAERPAENFQSARTQASGGGGNFGRVSLGRIPAQSRVPQYYPAQILVRGTAGGAMQSFSIDYLERRTNQADNFPAVRFTNIAVGDARVKSGLLVPDNVRYNPFVEVGDGAVINDLWLLDILNDRSAYAQSSGPTWRTQGTGRILRLHTSNLASVNLDYQGENIQGQVDRLLAMGTSVGANALGAVYSGDGKTIDVTASGYDRTGELAFMGGSTGTVTGKRGDAFGAAGSGGAATTPTTTTPTTGGNAANGITAYGTYEEDSIFISKTSGWQTGAGGEHSANQCIYTNLNTDSVTVNLNLPDACYFRIKTITGSGLGQLSLKVDGGTAVLVYQGRTNGQASGAVATSTTPSATIYTSPVYAAGQHTLVASVLANPDAEGKTTSTCIWDAIEIVKAS